MILEDILGEIGRTNNLSNFPTKLSFEEANIRLVNYNKASKQKEEVRPFSTSEDTHTKPFYIYLLLSAGEANSDSSQKRLPACEGPRGHAGPPAGARHDARTDTHGHPAAGRHLLRRGRGQRGRPAADLLRTDHQVGDRLQIRQRKLKLFESVAQTRYCVLQADGVSSSASQRWHIGHQRRPPLP